jgi:hypothetical protein
MELLVSSKLELPTVYYVTNREDIKNIPIGIPYIFGDKVNYNAVVKLLEYEVLYQSAKKTGLPFKFKKILEEQGYTKLKQVKVNESTTVQDYISDISWYVNIEKLKDLNLFPVWYIDNLEKAIEVNITNYALYDYNLYNKKLDGCYGDLVFTPPVKNLVIIDISSSIPESISATVLTLCKNLAESFYADVLITGSKSTLYEYENLWKLDINTIYKENGVDNDQVYFKELLSVPRTYNNCIVFGDYHNPGMEWNNQYNKGTKYISTEEGKELCQWNINKVISFHKDYNDVMAGYGLWFSSKEVEYVKDWVEYLGND